MEYKKLIQYEVLHAYPTQDDTIVLVELMDGTYSVWCITKPRWEDGAIVGCNYYQPCSHSNNLAYEKRKFKEAIKWHSMIF